jgi:hypothetical protein
VTAPQRTGKRIRPSEGSWGVSMLQTPFVTTEDGELSAFFAARATAGESAYGEYERRQGR